MSLAQFLQAIVDGLVAGSLWGLLGTGLGLILGVTGRFHFAFATTFVWAIYLAVWLVGLGAPLYVGVAGGIFCGMVLGVLFEWLLYRPLVQRTNQGLLAVFVTSLGVVIAGENIIRLIWGSSDENLSTGYTVHWLSLGHDVGLTTLDLVTFLVCAGVVMALWLFLRRARYGRAIRAVQENPDMARAVGISPEIAYVAVFAIGSTLAGLGAILLTQRGAAAPDAGVQPTFTALVVMFLAGLRSSPLRFLLAGLILGVIQQLCLVEISVSWSPVVTFGVLFVYISLTPFLAGRRIRRAGIPLQRAAAEV